jgi:integrase
MSDVIEQFCAEYHDYHAISPARRVDQVRSMRALEEHAGATLTEVGASDLSRWFQALISDGLAPTTVRKYRGHLAPFWRWAWRGKLIDAERYMELKDVPLPRGAVSNGTPNPYSRDEIKKLWADVALDYPWARDKRKRLTVEEQIERADYYLARWRNQTSSFRRVRAYANRLQIEAIIALCLMGGLRRDEAFGVALDNIDPDNAYIVVVGAAKNPEAEARPRAVPWTTGYLRTAVGRWLNFRAELAPPHDRVWLSLWGKTPLIRLPHRRYEMLLTQLGHGWEFRRLRHTAATEMLRNGYPLHEVQRIMGHARLDQTLRYAALLPDDVVRTAARHTEELSKALLPTAEVPTGVQA